jgi:hypothetical protein
MGTLIATAEGTGIDSMAIEQQLRELLALDPSNRGTDVGPDGRGPVCGA